MGCITSICILLLQKLGHESFPLKAHHPKPILWTISKISNMDRKWMTEENFNNENQTTLHELVYKYMFIYIVLNTFTHVLEFMLWLVDVIYDIKYND